MNKSQGQRFEDKVLLHLFHVNKKYNIYIWSIIIRFIFAMSWRDTIK